MSSAPLFDFADPDASVPSVFCRFSRRRFASTNKITAMPISNIAMPPASRPIVDPLNGASSADVTSVSDPIGKPEPSSVVEVDWPTITETVEAAVAGDGDDGTVTVVDETSCTGVGRGVALVAGVGKGVGGVGKGVGGVGCGVGLCVILIGSGDLHPIG